MKKAVKEFRVVLEDAEDEVRLNTADIVRLLRSETYLGTRIAISVHGIKDEGNVKDEDQEVYDHLLKKIKEATDADACSCWTSALDKFCSAIRTRAGG